MLVRFKQFQISPAFGRAPAENNGNVVDQGRLAQLLQRFLMVGDIHHAEENPQ